MMVAGFFDLEVYLMRSYKCVVCQYKALANHRSALFGVFHNSLYAFRNFVIHINKRANF